MQVTTSSFDIVRTINISIAPIGIKNISSNVPNQFKLYQNFPNPFNPVTNIKFEIANYTFSKIIIYNILGKEIERLVNEKLKPGEYEVNWDATNYPSGIYFYTIEAGNYVNSKKMVLVK